MQRMDGRLDRIDATNQRIVSAMDRMERIRDMPILKDHDVALRMLMLNTIEDSIRRMRGFRDSVNLNVEEVRLGLR